MANEENLLRDPYEFEKQSRFLNRIRLACSPAVFDKTNIILNRIVSDRSLCDDDLLFLIDDLIRWQKKLLDRYENLISFHETRLLSIKKEEEEE